MKIPVENLIEKYKDNLFAAAFSVCGNRTDADDVVQEAFLKYYTSKKEFDSEEHIRAWLIRVAINKARDLTRSFFRKKMIPLEEYMETLEFNTQESEDLFVQVMSLPEKYRIVIHLFYYEDYTVKEIAHILHLSESNIKVRLTRGRKLLREILEDDEPEAAKIKSDENTHAAIYIKSVPKETKPSETEWNEAHLVTSTGMLRYAKTGGMKR